MKKVFGLATKLCGLFLISFLSHCGQDKTSAPVAPGKNTRALKNLEPQASTPTPKIEPLIDRNSLFSEPSFNDPTLSPDGQYLSFLAPAHGVLNLWLQPSDGRSKPELLTALKDRGLFTNNSDLSITYWGWAYDSHHLFYFQDDKDDENDHLYAIDLQSRITQNLTPDPGTKTIFIQKSPERPSEIVVGWNKRDKNFFDLFLVDLKSGKLSLLYKNTEYSRFVLDDQFKIQLAEKVHEPDGIKIVRHSVDNGKTLKNLFFIPYLDSANTSVIGTDKSGNLLYLLESRDRDTSALASYDLLSKKESILRYDVHADAHRLLINPVSKQIEAVSFEFSIERWRFLDAQMEAGFSALRPIDIGTIRLISRTLDNSQWTVSFSTDIHPTHFYLYNRKTKTVRFLSSAQPALENQNFVPMKASVIRSRDGLALLAYVSRPLNATGPGPMVLLVHGGPWARDSWGFNTLHQWLANRGYSVLSVNFRGSTGYGKNFLAAGDKEWGGKMQNDLLDALKWAVESKIADPGKISIAGASYGGYATLEALAESPDTFACGVDFEGFSDLNALLKSIPAEKTSLLREVKNRMGDADSPQDAQLLADRSPVHHASSINKPLLISQAGRDPLVPEAQTGQIVDNLVKRGLHVTYLLYPEEGHRFSKASNRLSFDAIFENFLSKNLGGRAEPMGDDIKKSSAKILEGAQWVDGPH